jgi:hypothetical protein
LRLVIRPDRGAGTRAFITLGDHLGKLVGDIRVAGPRVVRIERHGTAVTVSVGISNAGKFEADMSQTVADAKAAVAELSEHHAKLFLSGKTTWTQLRLLTGRAAEPVRQPSTPAPVAGNPAATADASGRVVDLLRMIDVASNTVAGDFTLTPDGLTVKKAAAPKLQISYRPPEEYDLTIEFTYQDRDAALIVVLPLSEGPADLEFRADANDIKNDAGVVVAGTGPFAKTGRPSAAVIKVRHAMVQVYRESTMVLEFKRTGKALGVKKEWKMPSENAIGVGCYHSKALISKLTLTEISGHGERIVK